MIDENQLTGLSVAFIRLWRMLQQDLPDPTPEYHFAPPRKWRFDFAFLDHKLAIELEGGVKPFRNPKTGQVVMRGRHTRPKGYIDDCDKYNTAAELGWTVLRYTTEHLTKRPVQTIEQIINVLNN